MHTLICMEFFNHVDYNVLGMRKPGVGVRLGMQQITDERAETAARALGVVQAGWKRKVYKPQVDDRAIVEMGSWIGQVPDGPLRTELKAALESAEEHARRMGIYEELEEELFRGDVESLTLKQGKIGTCYVHAPSVSLHLRPHLLWSLLPNLFTKIKSARIKLPEDLRHILAPYFRDLQEDYDVNFPGIQGILGAEFPSSIDIKNFDQYVLNWGKDFNTQGELGDIAIESAFASAVSRGVNRQARMTRRLDRDGNMAVEGGYPDQMLASMVPPEWVQAHEHRFISNFPAISLGSFKADISNPRKILFYWLAGERGESVVLDGHTILKRHAYSIGRVAAGKVCLHNPHRPLEEIWISAEALHSASWALLGTVELNYKSTPLMEHARMIAGLPSRWYQQNYIRNVLNTHYSSMHELLCVSSEAGALTRAAEEFLQDPEFGELFREVGLDQYVQARAAGRPIDFNNPVHLPKRAQRLPTPVKVAGASSLGCLGLLTVGGVGVLGAVNLLSEENKEEPQEDTVSCPPSLPGRWEFLSGKDLLKEGNPLERVNLAVLVPVAKDTHFQPVEVNNYPYICLGGHAPYSVAAELPVVKDQVQVWADGQVGFYHFHPEIDASKRNELQIVDGNFKVLSGTYHGAELTCRGRDTHPMKKTCSDETMWWRTLDAKASNQ